MNTLGRVYLVPLLIALALSSWSIARAAEVPGKLYLPVIQAAVSPGTRLAFSSEGKIYIMGEDGSKQTALAEGTGPTWSPGNARIAFVDSAGNIAVINADGSGLKNLTNDPASEYGPVWAPGGTQIAFLRRQQSSDPNLFITDIFVMNADGANQKNLTNQPAEYSSLLWSPAGARLAFLKGEGDEPGTHIPDLYVINVDGSGLKNLSNHPGYEYDPAWSPDGTRIAFTGERGSGQTLNNEVYVVNVDGGGPINLTNFPGNDYGPAWTPDGAKIAFTSYRGDNWYLHVMNADGANQTKLSTEAGFYRNLSWTADGSKIAFLNNWVELATAGTVRPGIICCPETYTDIGVMDASGSNLKRLTYYMDPSPPVWSR